MGVNPKLAALHVRHPIIQAPMAGVSTPALAAAVSNAGGLGSLGAGAGGAAKMAEMIRATRALTSAPFNVNVFCHRPAHRDEASEQVWTAHMRPLFEEVGAAPPGALQEPYRSFLEDPDSFDVLCRERPAVVSFHFGLPPDDWIVRLHALGISLLACVTSLEEGLQAQQAGIDMVIAQGVEAGGHRGCFDADRDDAGLSMAVLVRLLVSRLRIPVIAAGGIMDGRAVRAALDLGAVAAQLGTAFVLCPESSANAAYREALQGPAALSTRMTRAISGRPARGIVNRLVRHAESDPLLRPPAYPVTYDLTRKLIAAAPRMHDFAVQWAGQGAPLARAMPAAQLLQTLLDECAA